MTLAYGIRGWKNDGELHRGLEGYFQENEPAQITLRTLGNLCRANAQQEDVYVLENPAVFSSVIEKYPVCAAVCAGGQPGLATLILLDLLKENHTFHYAGDFDPEGLLIALTMLSFNILELYIDDFRKIDPSGRASRLFASIPAELSRNTTRYKIGSVIENATAARLGELLMDMADSMTVNFAYHADDPGVGFSLHADYNYFKMFLADTGLFVTLAFMDRDYTRRI